jgi:hypothetical protein
MLTMGGTYRSAQASASAGRQIRSGRKIPRVAEGKIGAAADDAGGMPAYARFHLMFPPRKEKSMLNPSRPLVIALSVAAFVGLVLGLDTDAGLFCWSFAVLVGLYLAAAGIARATRRSG